MLIIYEQHPCQRCTQVPFTVGMYLNRMPTGTEAKKARVKRNKETGTPRAATPACSNSCILLHTSACIFPGAASSLMSLNRSFKSERKSHQYHICHS